ncbi:MAG TPA: hypothetical protein VGK89_11615 [Candidatus Eisenbacteria bacterium]|jgi:hypothetical protein
MSTPFRERPPVSTRRALALALDLALRRDPLQSIVVPVLLRAPWILTIALLSPGDESEGPRRAVLLGSLALLGDYLTLTITSAMLRLRARSVFDAAPGTRPAPALDCYARGLARLPWLVVTEVVRNLGAAFGLLFFIVPGIVLGYRLSLAAEAVTLDEPHLSAAFERSFRLSTRRFERWLELCIASALPVILVWFAIAMRTLIGSDPVPRWWFTAALLLFAAWTPIVLYAWTFFYLRLSEIDSPGVEVGPMYAEAAAPASEPMREGEAPAPPAAAEPGTPDALAAAVADPIQPSPARSESPMEPVETEPA